MTKDKFELIVGSLLHDVGKVVYRQGDKRRHSISGYDFLKQDVGIDNEKILESVRYHHGAELKGANISNNSYAYITYIADNIAASVDRRKRDNEDYGFEQEMSLESVFNILNGNDKKMYYHRGMLGEENIINYPTLEKEKFDEHFYLKVMNQIKDNLKSIEWDKEYINSLVELMEANLTYIPSSTAKDELADISLFDHSKLTAAAGSCIYDYLAEKGVTDYKDSLFDDANKFYDEEVFMMLSMDISGIQNFIYTIHSEGALKNLRSRSFYLEMMMEHIVDTLLDRLDLSKANLIYSGGGHCYILVANTKKTETIIQEFEKELNQWLLDEFNVALYMAIGYVRCSANSLKNYPQGSYSEIFRSVADMISKKKSCRYTPGQIMKLNNKKNKDFSRECKICKSLDNLNEENVCHTCEAIQNLSKDILHAKFFAIYKGHKEKTLKLPFECYLSSRTEEEIKKDSQGEELIRVYGKNAMYTGKKISSRIFVGNYTTGETFEELAKKSQGIPRIGVLRADIDNLGAAFVSGFENEKNQDKYVSLSRTATLSRQLSIFFKYHINSILKKSVYSLEGDGGKKRNAAIVYSGGDDVFIVGSWNDVIELAVDIRDAFDEYTEGTLTLSAGIGIYQSGFPINVSAKETEQMESASKKLSGKNAVTLLPDGKTHQVEEDGNMFNISDGTYNWDMFLDEVIGEKFYTIKDFFENTEDRGKNFLYNLLELIRNRGEKINIARYIYLLARLEPKQWEDEVAKETYRIFSENMYEWIKDETSCRQLKTAINLYAYLVREKED